MTAAGDVSSSSTFNQALNPNGVVALRSATQSMATGGGGTLVSFDSEEFDNAGMITPTSTNVTIQTDGLYLVTCYVEWAANATGYRGVDIFVNGVSSSGITTSIATGAATTRMTATNQFLLAALDVLTFNCIQNSGSALNITARAGVTRITGS